MAMISIFIEDISGKKFKAQLPDDAAVSRILPQLLKKLNLSHTIVTGQHVSYRLIHRESGEQTTG